MKNKYFSLNFKKVIYLECLEWRTNIQYSQVLEIIFLNRKTS